MRAIIAFAAAYALMRVSRHVFPCGSAAPAIEESIKRFLLARSPSRYALFGLLEAMATGAALCLLAVDSSTVKPFLLVALHASTAKLPIIVAIAAHAAYNAVGALDPAMGALMIVCVSAIEALRWLSRQEVLD